jgi:hypothetical protein
LIYGGITQKLNVRHVHVGVGTHIRRRGENPLTGSMRGKKAAALVA